MHFFMVLFLFFSGFSVALEFDDTLVKTEILPLLKQHFNPECKDECDVYKHNITLQKQLSDTRRLILSQSFEPACFSFGCGAEISVFDYYLINNKWFLSASSFQAFSVGHSGAGASAIEIRKIAEDKYAILAYDDFMQQGVEGRYVVIVMRVNNKFKEVANIKLESQVDASMNLGLNYANERDAYFDKRFHGYISEFSFKPIKGNSFPSIIVKHIGHYDDSLKLLKIPKKEVYNFVGNHYQLVE